ncbi:MAG: ribonucleotide-diphosphate reductase subunit beta [Actinomycetota bacterium]|nr:ribonucleotide-diphosphate reductase subunit beta [Actinomycetota bacterium]
MRDPSIGQPSDLDLESAQPTTPISYERLYRLWEENPWSATGLDFSQDKVDWAERLTEQQREAALWNYAMFLVGEEAVARTLTPVCDAAPEYPQKIFLTTQIVDEARHHVFFDRFMREVAAQGRDTRSTLGAVERHLTWGFKQVFAELDRVTEQLRKKPNELPLLAQSIAIYHVTIEGVLAIPGQHFIQRYVEKMGILPGFKQGIDNVSRDESRHVAFGIKMLSDLVRSSRECRQAAIEMWDRVMPWSVGVFVPPNLDRSYAECFDFTLNEIYAFGLRSFETKLARIGIKREEIRMLSRYDLELSYDERARQAWTLIDAGVIGDDTKEPNVTPEAMEILFDGMARATNLDVARSLGGPIEWSFTDMEPWHLVVTNGHAEAKPGRAGEPALRMEASAADFAKIAVGRTDPRWALLKRRLRVHGSLSAKAKLPKLFV